MEKQKKCISLRKFKENDLERLVDIINHPYILGYLEIDNFNPEKEIDWLNVVLLSYNTKLPNRYNLAINLRGEVIGSVGIHDIDYEKLCAEVGYWLGVEYHGKGYAIEAVNRLIKIVHRRFSLKNLSAKVHEVNYASRKVLEKNGFIIDGLIAPTKNNSLNNYLRYVLLLKP